MQRYLSITANVEGEDLAGPPRQIEDALQQAGEPPQGVHVENRGQVAPMKEMFESLAHRPGHGRGRHPRAADGVFPVAAPGPGLASAPCPASLAAWC